MTLDCTITKVEQTGAVDDYGNPTDVETTLETTCWLHQSMRDEASTNANTQEETWRIYLPPTVDVEGFDRAAVAGVTYEFVGPPWRAFNPRLEAYTHFEGTVRRAQ